MDASQTCWISKVTRRELSLQLTRNRWTLQNKSDDVKIIPGELVSCYELVYS